MSIKPLYSNLILDGEKLWELRRQPLKVKSGDMIFVYASSPVQAVIGAFTILSVISRPVAELWNVYHEDLGIGKRDYFAYFEGATTAYAIRVGPSTRIEPITLDDLRSKNPRFRPPQSYMYWPKRMNSLLSISAIRQIQVSTTRIELQRRLRFQYPIMYPMVGCAKA